MRLCRDKDTDEVFRCAYLTEKNIDLFLDLAVSELQKEIFSVSDRNSRYVLIKHKQDGWTKYYYFDTWYVFEEYIDIVNDGITHYEQNDFERRFELI